MTDLLQPASPLSAWPGTAQPGRDGLRHLVRRCRCLCPPGPPKDALPEVAILGTGPATPALALALALRLPRLAVVEPDPDTAARLAAHLARHGAGQVAIGPTVPAAAGLVLARGRDLSDRGMGSWPERAILAVLVDGPDEGAPEGALRLRLVMPGAGLVELWPTRGLPDAGAGLAAAMGCVPLVLPPGAEGPAARLLARHEATAEALCLAGVAPWELDEAAEAAGFAIGPCALMDRLGLPSAVHRRTRLATGGTVLPPPLVLSRMLAEGRLGRAASVGWYRYPGGGGQVTDPLIDDLVREEARFAGIAPRPVPAAALGRHLLAALVDEAARLWAEGAAGDPGDIDLAAVRITGFPRATGGPLRLLARQGRAPVLAALAALAGDLAGLPGLPAPGIGVDGLDLAPVPVHPAAASPVKRPEG